FTRACNQPWQEIHRAQVGLKRMLDRGNTLTFIANADDADVGRRTEITMSRKGQTFANSIISQNVPGSEVFSAPVMDSVNGQIFAAVEYLYDGFLMKDIFLKVKDGAIVEAKAL